MKLAREFGIEVSDQSVEAVFQPCDGNSFLGEEYDVERIADRIVSNGAASFFDFVSNRAYDPK